MAKKNSNKKTLLIVLTIFGILLFAAALKIYEEVLASNVNLPENEKAFLYIHTNKSFDENLYLIEETGILKNTQSLGRLMRIAGYTELIKPGKYEINNAMNNIEIMRLLVSGRQQPFDIVFKYAQRNSDIAGFWGQQLEADSVELIELLNSNAFCDSLGFTPQTIIGLFIPNTYNFYWNTSSYKLITRMKEEYEKFWNTEDRQEKLKALNMDINSVITLASIVQKETNQTAEMPDVAGVYINRIKKGMPLQADPTIIFAMNDNSIKRVYGKMLEIESPYNTYKYKGLPPGPICVPSSKTIDAVLNYHKHTYIYFCAKEDFSGFHNFASNFTQHQINARKYQHALNNKGITIK